MEVLDKIKQIKLSRMSPEEYYLKGIFENLVQQGTSWYYTCNDSIILETDYMYKTIFIRREVWDKLEIEFNLKWIDVESTIKKYLVKYTTGIEIFKCRKSPHSWI